MYAHRKYLFRSLTRASEQGEIKTVYGSIPYQRGDYIGIDVSGSKKVIIKEMIKEYIAVDIRTEKVLKTETEIGKGYTEMALLPNDESEIWLPVQAKTKNRCTS